MNNQEFFYKTIKIYSEITSIKNRMKDTKTIEELNILQTDTVALLQVHKPVDKTNNSKSTEINSNAEKRLERIVKRVSEINDKN